MKNIQKIANVYIAKKNYSNLIFMNAYGEFTRTRYIVKYLYLSSGLKEQKKGDVIFTKLAKAHLKKLDELSEKDKLEMLKIDKNYYLGQLQSLHISESISPSRKSNKPAYYWAKRAFDYVNAHKEYNYTFGG